MLTGEWGCGKTYLLNNKLTKELKDTHIILRISLFGISSVDKVKTDVKQKWLYAWTESKDNSGRIADKVINASGKIKKVAEIAKDKLPDGAKNIVDSVLSINVLDFVKIDSMIGDKKVVLIFDDLERANISTTDLLGCINDYCENLGFSTIVVTNEEKISGDNGERIKYNEIKEKIIQRTIHHLPEYKVIVDSVIDNMQFKAESYKELIKKYSKDIIVIFSGTTTDGKSLDEFTEFCTKGRNHQDIETENQRIRELLEKRPHNIRSLKCALQDFFRVYELLVKYEVPDIHKWLFSFITYVFSCRAGLVHKDERYGWEMSENNICKLYPGYYNNKYISGGIKSWIREGEWNDGKINAELAFAKKRDSAISVEEKVRTYRVYELEECDVSEGYPLLLSMAYDGELDLDEYVDLLCNSSWAREYKITIPPIDWNRMLQGVDKKINELLQSHIEPSHYRKVIGDENIANFTKDEWKIYESIKKYRDGEIQIYENNKNLYIQLIKEDPIKAYEEIKNKRLDSFSEKMAEATLQAFIDTLNVDRNDLITCCKRIISAMMNFRNFKKKQTCQGLELLKSGLEDYLEQCNKNNNTIAAFHTRYFLESIDEFLNEIQ